MMKLNKFLSQIVIVFCLLIGLVGCQSQAGTQQPSTPLKQLNSNAANDYQVAMDLAQASLKSGNPEVAERAFQVAHRNMPSQAAPVVGLGQLYIDGGQYQKALNWNQQALAQFKQQPEVQSQLNRQLGLAYLHLKQVNLAAQSLLTAYDQTKHPAQVLNDLGVLLDQLGQHSKAQLCYRQGLTGVPTNPVLLNNYALSLLYTGDVPQAKKILNSPAILASENSAVEYNRKLAMDLLAKNSQSSQDLMTSLQQRFGFSSLDQTLNMASQKSLLRVCHMI